MINVNAPKIGQYFKDHKGTVTLELLPFDQAEDGNHELEQPVNIKKYIKNAADAERIAEGALFEDEDLQEKYSGGEAAKQYQRFTTAVNEEATRETVAGEVGCPLNLVKIAHNQSSSAGTPKDEFYRTTCELPLGYAIAANAYERDRGFDSGTGVESYNFPVGFEPDNEPKFVNF